MSFAGHFPAKAVISCKYWSSPLDQKDIDHFNGEFISSGAQIGILYSRSGYNHRALEKAKVLGFHCCKLYQDDPAELPEDLALGLAYHFRPTFRINVRGAAETYGFKLWKDLFALNATVGPLLSALAQRFDAFQKCTDPKARWGLSRDGQSTTFNVRPAGRPPLDVELQAKDRSYQAKVEYTMLNGSYNMTAGHFAGSEATPWMDTKSTHPGPGWSELLSLPQAMPEKRIAMYMQVDALAAFTEFGETPFPATRG